MKHRTIVHENQCVGCGLCVKDCVAACIKLENGKAQIQEEFCIGCGHCYAICPKGAVELQGWGDGGGESVSAPVDPDALLGMIKSRRTTRQFLDKPIPDEIVSKLLEAGRYAPTAENHQVVEFIVLDQVRREAERRAVNKFRKAQAVLSKVVPWTGLLDVDDQFFFKGAPLVLLVTNKADMDAGLASAYVELMANAYGLGVLYSGFFRVVCKINPSIRKLLPIRRGYKLSHCMVIGYPSVKYQRVPPRFPVKLKRG